MSWSSLQSLCAYPNVCMLCQPTVTGSITAQFNWQELFCGFIWEFSQWGSFRLSPQCAFRRCFLSSQFVRPWKSVLETVLFSAWTSHTSPSCCRNWDSQRAKALRWSSKWISGESGQEGAEAGVILPGAWFLIYLLAYKTWFAIMGAAILFPQWW